MMDELKIAKVDIGQIVRSEFAGKKIPGFFIKILKWIGHEEGLNKLYASAPGKKNLEFVDACMDFYRIKCDVNGLENLPADGKPLIFVSNHPLGALDAICIAHVIGHRYNGKINFYANEILTWVEPLKEKFIPVSKKGYQNRESVKKVQEFFQSDEHVVIFPAGATSRKYGDKIIDLEWQKNFVQKSVQYQRDVIPLYFKGKNSTFFYLLEKFREMIRSKVNFEMLFLVDEIFKQRGNTFTLYIGKPVGWQTFDNTKTPGQWAQTVKKMVYKLPENE